MAMMNRQGRAADGRRFFLAVASHLAYRDATQPGVLPIEMGS
jgi:hypothetical protein